MIGACDFVLFAAADHLVPHLRRADSESVRHAAPEAGNSIPPVLLHEQAAASQMGASPPVPSP
eukprot:7485674-Alexandrium_andersonii.AAC.1